MNFYKKIFLLFVSIFFYSTSNAELLDYYTWSIRFSYWFTKINYWTWVIYTYTWGINLDTSKKLYIKSLDCYHKNYTQSVYPSEFEVTLSPNNWYSQNIIRTYERLQTWSVLYKSYPVYQVYTWSILWFQLRNFFDNSNINNTTNTLCYINWSYFENYINLSLLNDMGTWSIVINNNISNESLNIFQSEDSMKDFYVFEFAIIMVILSTLFLYRLIRG